MVQRQSIFYQKQQNFNFSNIISSITHNYTHDLVSICSTIRRYKLTPSIIPLNIMNIFRIIINANFILYILFFFIKVSVPVKSGLVWSLQGKNIESSAVLFFEHTCLLFSNLSLEYLTSYLVHKHRSVTLVTSNSVLLSNCPRISYRTFLDTKKEKESFQSKRGN